MEEMSNAVDSRSIEGWDKVDQLATQLMESKGLSITNEEAENFVQLYEHMYEYDKQPLIFFRKLQPARGRFDRSKNSTGHDGQEAMKRYIGSGVAPSLPPSKSL